MLCNLLLLLYFCKHNHPKATIVMKQVYKSKVDTWLIVLVYGVMIVSIILAVYDNKSWIGIGIIVLTLAIISMFLFSIKYTIENDKLYIYCANLYIECVDINKITEISATRTLLSAPASSLDRLRIKYGYDEIIISPKDKEKFIENICRISHNNIKVNLTRN